MDPLVLVLAVAVGVLGGGSVVWRSVQEDEPEIPSLTHVVPLVGELDAVSHELERARRYERPFVLLHVPVETTAGDGDVDAETDVLEAVLGTLRTIDVAWSTDTGIDILLPEIDRAGGAAYLERASEVVPELVRDARVAVYPEDGLTRGALLSKLHDDADASPVIVPRFGAVEPPRPSPRWAS